jgi:hypothetical protein
MYLKINTITAYPIAVTMGNFIMYGHVQDGSKHTFNAKYDDGTASGVNALSTDTDTSWMGQFRHYIVTNTYNNASSTSFALYVNGVFEASNTSTTPLSSASRTLTVGGNSFGDGTIAYLRIWDGTAMSASDVSALYRSRNVVNSSKLNFHVNDQLSLAITDNGLAMPQYGVEMKGNYTAASIEPTYAWEFRNNTGSAVVNDLVSGVAAAPQNGATSDATGMNLNASEHVWLYNLSFGTSFSIEMYFELTNYTIDFSRLFQYAPQEGDGATSKMWLTVDSYIKFGGNAIYDGVGNADQAVLTSDPVSSSVFYSYCSYKK